MAGAKKTELTQEQLVGECKKVMNEGAFANKYRSVVGLFSQYDDGVMERMVGSLAYKQMISTQAKDNFSF